MPRVVPILALALVAVGVAFPLMTGTQSMTAWIPAMLGGALLLLGLWKHPTARVVSMLVALAGVAASVWRLSKGTIDMTQPSHQSLAITSILCGAVLGALLMRRSA
jgi:hypothetical protein